MRTNQMPTSIRIGMGIDGDISDSSRLSRRSLAPGLIVEEGLELSIVKDDDAEEMFLKIEENRAYLRAVSYTHLTLPTNREV